MTMGGRRTTRRTRVLRATFLQNLQVLVVFLKLDMPPLITTRASASDLATSSTTDSDVTTTLRTGSSVTLSNDSASTSRLSSDSDDSSASEDDDSGDDEDETSADYLSLLLQKARSAARSNTAKLQLDEVAFGEQDHIKIGDDQSLSVKSLYNYV